MECGVGFWAIQSSCTTVWYHEKNHLNTAHDGATRRRLLSTSTAVPTSNLRRTMMHERQNGSAAP